jgi:antiviral helicase SLH1
MDLTDVLQMLGRAGRPQFDTSGIARILTQDSKKAFYKHFLHTGFPVESSLHNVLDNHLGAEVSAETIATRQDALDYLTWTFFFRRLHKNPSYYGLEIPAEENDSMTAQQAANDYMVDMVDHSMSELADSGCLTLYPNGEVEPTPMGKIMSYYYLSHKTIRTLVKHATPTATFENVLSWMCRATEYDELPVRHNEDLINAELSSTLPLKGDNFGLPMWDPHVKAFLLLQAHFSRIDLPISDYVGDQNSVLDQAIRIIQASIDVLTELGHLQSCRMMMTLLQAVKSARWPDDGPLSILPGVEPEVEKKRMAKDSVKPNTIIAATTAPRQEIESALKTLSLPSSAHPKALKALAQLPQLRVGVANTSATGLSVSISRLNPAQNKEYNIFAPRYPKPQTEGYFLLVSDAASGDVLGLKRVSWPSPDKLRSGNNNQGPGSGGSNPSRPSTRASVRLPESKSERTVKVKVVSDSYLGMEWEIEDVKIPAKEVVMSQTVEAPVGKPEKPGK